MKYISIDIETTGLDPLKHNIIEFGAVLDDLKNPKPLDQLPKFHAYILRNEYCGEPYALSMHPTIFRRIATQEEGFNYIYASKLGQVFQKYLVNQGYEKKRDKITINAAGKNFASLDWLFLKNQTDFATHIQPRSRIVDPAILYYQIGDDEKLPDLKTCLERAGIKKEVAHTAIEDAFDVIKLIRFKFLGEI